MFFFDGGLYFRGRCVIIFYFGQNFPFLDCLAAFQELDDSRMLLWGMRIGFIESHFELFVNVLLFGTEGGFRDIFNDRSSFLDTHGSFDKLIIDNLRNLGQR